jgi:branched-chain amino acid transport system substrate-binding protein
MTGTRIRMTAALAAIALAGGTTACGGDDEKDAAGEPVKVGGIFDLSGQTAEVGTPYADGIKGFVRYWNGAGERPQIDLTSEDYKYDVDVAKDLYSRLKSEGVVALQGWGTGDTEALGGRVTTDRIAFMSASYAEALTKPSTRPFNFVPGTSYSDQMRIALRWISEQASGAGVASFHSDSRFGRSPQKAGAQMAKQLGLGFKRYAMARDPEDDVAQLRRARSRGTKFVVIQNVSPPAARLVKQIAQLRLDVKIVCLNWCGDELFIERAGDAANGTIGVLPFAPVTVKAAGFARPRAFLSERGRTLDQEGLHYIQGWYTMALMAEGIKRAADNGTVTGDSIKRALEEMDAFDTGGVSPPIEFTAESHAGMKESKLYVVKNEQWSQLTDLRQGS